MKKLTFGTPEELVPSKFCKNFNYAETSINFDIGKITYKQTQRGFLIEFPLTAKEGIYGFGLQLKQFNHKTRKVVTRVNSDPTGATGDSHAPVPFFASTEGYGMYFDTARYVEFNCGIKKQNCSDFIMSILIPNVQGVDVYVMEGKNITEVVSQYNMLSGGGCDVPEWGLGVFYRCDGRYNAEQVLKTADYFREKDIPCSILGLEPGWQTQTYSCSYVWNSERFPDPKAMIDKLKEKGFHINLWQHAFTHPTSPLYDDIKKYSGDCMVWNGVVPDFALPEARKIYADYQRKIQTDIGVDGMKLDECDSSDYTGGWSFPLSAEFPSGLDGEQYHSLFGVLYCQTMNEALNNQPTLSEVRCMGALGASYPYVLYSDLYSHDDFIQGVVNAGFSGLLWSPEVRHADSEKDMIRRMQTIVFSVQCLINGWYCMELPWLKFGIEDKVRETLKMREKVIPMLKKAFEEYHKTGKPPIRAVVSDYSDDPETYNLGNEYIFCDNLIVAPLTAASDERDVYLPAGKWVDWHTKQPVEAGKFRVKTDNIPVFERID